MIVSSVAKRLVTVYVHMKVLYSYFYVGKQFYLQGYTYINEIQ